MTVLTIVISERAMRALEQVSRDTGRTVSDLAESAVEDAAVHAEPATSGYAQTVYPRPPQLLGRWPWEDVLEGPK